MWLLVLLCLLAQPATATAPRVEGSPSARLIARVDGLELVQTDHRRYALIPRGGGRFSLRDDANGRTRAVDFGACRPGDGSYGVFLVHCGESGFRVFSARTTRSAPIPGVEPGDRLGSMGRHWAWGDGASGHIAYVNWRTGQRIQEPQRNTHVVPVRDPDSPGLKPVPPVSEDRLLIFRAPLGVLVGDRALDLYETGERVTRLSDCPLLCEPETVIAPDRVLWLDRGGYGSDCRGRVPSVGRRCFVARGHVAATGRRARWHISRVTPRCVTGCFMRLATTRRRVYITVVTSIGHQYNPAAGKTDEVPAGWRVYAADWPG